MDRQELIKRIIEVTGEEDKWGILRKDENGYFVEYAFRDGAPEDNRCLSWYDKPQIEAYKRNGWDDEHIAYTIERIESKVGEIRYLSKFCCSSDNIDDKERLCRPGHPSKACLEQGNCSCWTYDEPKKCACWHLGEKIDEQNHFNLSIDEIERLIARYK